MTNSTHQTNNTQGLRDEILIALDTSFSDYDYPSSKGDVSSFELTADAIMGVVTQELEKLIAQFTEVASIVDREERRQAFALLQQRLEEYK